MALPQIISRNVAQKIATLPIVGRVVIQPETWYTCPTGKKAIIKGRVQCTGRGAAATATVKFAGVIMFTWSNSSTPIATGWMDRPDTLSDINGGQFAFFEAQLAAGETMITEQNTGTNAEFNVWAEVQETDV